MDENQITINGHVVSFHEMDDAGRIRFKLDNTWRDPMDFIIPGCTAFEYIMRIHNFGGEKLGFWSRETKGFASGSEIRRWLDNSAVRFNGVPKKSKERLDSPVHSIVLFPKGNRITIL